MTTMILWFLYMNLLIFSMRSAIKPFFPTLFPGGHPGKPLHREPCLDPEILRDVERIIEVDETVITDRFVAGQNQQTQNQGDEQFFAIDGSESIRFHSWIPIFPSLTSLARFSFATA